MLMERNKGALCRLQQGVGEKCAFGDLVVGHARCSKRSFHIKRDPEAMQRKRKRQQALKAARAIASPRLGCTVEGGTLKRPASSSSALSVEYFEARRL